MLGVRGDLGGVIAACDNHAGIVLRFGWSVLIWGAVCGGLPLGVPGQGLSSLGSAPLG